MVRLLLCVLLAAFATPAFSQMKTWDEKHDISRIKVSLVYYLPNDRNPLPDWRDRVDYFAKRLEQFHKREFGDQSVLTAEVRAVPLVSKKSTAELRDGDGDFTFFATLRETAEALDFGKDRQQGFPILLVMSDINHRPLDDFYRVRPTGDGWEFEGTLIGDKHFPGAAAGGSRATFLSHLGQGWGLVSADGWRVPYRGSDCVAWHEGVGHSVGIPHPEPSDSSVMSQGQYTGWLNESYVNKSQMDRLGYERPPEEGPLPNSLRLFNTLTALPQPEVPTPGNEVVLRVTLPSGMNDATIRVATQTDLAVPFEVVREGTVRDILEESTVSLGRYDAPTPVSYKVTVTAADSTAKDSTAEVWGYFQVRGEDGRIPTPPEGTTPLQDATPYGG